MSTDTAQKVADGVIDRYTKRTKRSSELHTEAKKHIALLAEPQAAALADSLAHAGDPSRLT